VRRLRLQLIGIMALAVLLPLLPAAWVTRELFRRSLDPLLETSILNGTQAGLAATRRSLEQEKARFRERIETGQATDTLTAAEIREFDRGRRAALETALREWSARQEGRRARILVPPERIISGRDAMLIALVRDARGSAAWLAWPLPRELGTGADDLTRGIQLLQTLRRERPSLIRGMEATFVVVYGVLVLFVLLGGLYLASRLTRPMAALGRGIEQVAAGDLEARVPELGGGEVGALLRNFNDMVRRLRTQQSELVRLEKLSAWRQMARRLAHEVKNPLTPIQLAAQELRDAYPGEDPRFRSLLRESTAIIEEEVEGLRALVSEFSQFARLPEPRPSCVDAAELLEDVAALYGSGKISVRIEDADGAAGTVSIWCDREQIRRAILNLVDNALAAQEAVGRATPIEVVASATPDGGARLRVLDRGPGVPESERRRIFEPDVSTKPDGMGLGLAIVESTVQSHAGSVHVADRDGGGAEFVIVLPPGSSAAREESR
jgi:nitrogen fixation/metabolism regulation signal transduction histidine kinase